MLVGMFKNSSLYNPLRNPQGVKNRRNVVFSQMEKYDYISEKVKDSLQALPLILIIHLKVIMKDLQLTLENMLEPL